MLFYFLILFFGQFGFRQNVLTHRLRIHSGPWSFRRAGTSRKTTHFNSPSHATRLFVRCEPFRRELSSPVLSPSILVCNPEGGTGTCYLMVLVICDRGDFVSSMILISFMPASSWFAEQWYDWLTVNFCCLWYVWLNSCQVWHILHSLLVFWLVLFWLWYLTRSYACSLLFIAARKA